MLPSVPPFLCEHCKSALDPAETAWLPIDPAEPLALCEECWHWHCEAFTPIAAILEAILIIKAHQALLHALEVAR